VSYYAGYNDASLTLVSLAGVPGATGATGPTGSIGAVTNWASGTTYSAGNVVFCPQSGACSTGAQGSSWVFVNATPTAGQDPYNNATYWQQIAAAGLNGSNGSVGATGATGATGPAGTAATGASPSGVPYSVSTYSISQASANYLLPGGQQYSAGSLYSAVLTYVPTACTPSMTFYNNTGVSLTPNLISVTVSGFTYTNAGSTSPTLSCTASGGSSCSVTATGQLSAGQYISITAPSPNGNYGVASIAFSCQ
jgi:hypothetical protein